MTDWTSPKTSDTHTNELAATRGRDESNARMNYDGDTNIPNGTKRWSDVNQRFEVWDAVNLTWTPLSSKYAINVDQLDGADAGNASGNVPLNNGTVNTNLNADMVDGKHAGNASGNVPVSNGTVNTDLNADMVDGKHAGNASGNVPVSNGTVNTDLNADQLDGQHGSFYQARGNHTGTQAPGTISPQGAGSGLDADTVDGKHASEIGASTTHIVFSSNGTFTVPSGVSVVFVTMIGGGGGGGCVSGTITSAAGGAGGAYFKYPYPVTAGSNISVVIGAGGARGGAYTPGGNGGDTWFGSLKAAGGQGGTSASPPGVSGAQGEPANKFMGEPGIGENGGSSIFGYGGGLGADAIGYGAGGGGGGTNNYLYGGYGKQGICFIEW